jgi:hypothetical protein
MKSETASTFSGTPRDSPLAICSIIRRYWASWAFYGFGPSFIFAIYPLFLRSRALDQFQVNAVAAWYLVVTLPHRGPDRSIRRRGRPARLGGNRMRVPRRGLYLYFVSHHYWHFIIAETLEGFATPSGTVPSTRGRSMHSTPRGSLRIGGESGRLSLARRGVGFSGKLGASVEDPDFAFLARAPAIS